MNQEIRAIPKTPVPIQSDLKAWLKHQAIDNGRTLQQEIVFRLEESRKGEEAQHEKWA